MKKKEHIIESELVDKENKWKPKAQKIAGDNEKVFDIIQIENYLLAVDKQAPCPVNTWAIFPNTSNGKIRDYEGCNPILCKSDYAVNGNSNLHIIAHLPLSDNAKPLEGVYRLPNPLEQQGIHKDAYDVYDKFLKGGEYNHLNKIEESILSEGFVWGYTKAVGYTEEDMMNCFNKGLTHPKYKDPKETYYKYLKSLKPIPIAFEAEEQYSNDNVHWFEDKEPAKFLRLKVENNTLIGRYIYE